VFRKDGVYLYDALGHALVLVAVGDQRSQIGDGARRRTRWTGRAGRTGSTGRSAEAQTGIRAEAQAGRPAGAQAWRAAVRRADPARPGVGRLPVRRRDAGAEV
jgi:hypothetical protein